MENDNAANLRDLIARTGAELGISGFELNEEGVLAYQMNDRYVVTLEVDEKENEIALACLLGPLSGTKDRDVFLFALLEANWMGVATNGASLGIDVQRDAVVLSRIVHGDGLRPNQLAHEYKMFLEAADAWVDYIQNGFPEMRSDPPKPDQSDSSQNFISA